jgi:hypothetical protein
MCSACLTGRLHAALLFSPPQELEAVGAGPELDRMVAEAEAKAAAKKAAAVADGGR